MSLIRIPSRNGLLWITGVTSAAVIGIIEAPLAIAFAAVPIINEYLNAGSGTDRGRSTASTSVTATSRRTTGTGRAKATTAKRSTARRGSARRPTAS